MLRYAAALHAVAVLADDDSGGESKKAGPIALLVILLLAIACFFLFRSMSKHLRRVREGFPTDDAPAARTAERRAEAGFPRRRRRHIERERRADLTHRP